MARDDGYRGSGGRGGRSGGGRGGGDRGGGDRGGRGRSDGGRGPRDGGRGGGGRGEYRGGGGRDGRGSGRGDRGGGGRGPNLSNIDKCETNILLAQVSPSFYFWMLGVDCQDKNGKLIDSRFRRNQLWNIAFWDTFLKDVPKTEKDNLKRAVFFQTSAAFASRDIPGLAPDQLPITLTDGSKTGGDVLSIVSMRKLTAPKELTQAWNPALVKKDELVVDFRCANCTRAFTDQNSLFTHCRETAHQPIFQEQALSGSAPASVEEFTMYVNVVLERAMGERFARWGREYIDPNSMQEPVDKFGNPMGVRVFKAYSCHFNFMRRSNTEAGTARLTLTVDLRAKLRRTESVLDQIFGGNPNTQLSPRAIADAKREWEGQTVITTYDRKCYSIEELIFTESPNSLQIAEKKISHAQYFATKLGEPLKYPNVRLMVAVQGRNKRTIHMPPELVTGNELDRAVKEKLPFIASFKPDERKEALDQVARFLVPGAQKTREAGGLLPAVGITLQSANRIEASASVLPIPFIMASGVQVPAQKGENWAPLLTKASFSVNPKQAIVMKVVVIHFERLQQDRTVRVYNKIRDMVNRYDGKFRFSDSPHSLVPAGDGHKHYGVVEKHFTGKQPDNVFVLDFSRPNSRGGAGDPAYHVVKQILGKYGYVSQFVNFNTYNHDNPQDLRKSDMILQGVARQILWKTGTRLWWVKLPESVPLPALFVGVDVFHAPRVFDPKTKTKSARASCAAIVVEIVRSRDGEGGVYAETFERSAGQEYQLGDALRQTVGNAMKLLNVNPMSCIVWRDGIGDSAFEVNAFDEIRAIRNALSGGNVIGQADEAKSTPMAYIVCQKRIDTKFLVNRDGGTYGAPSGTLVEGLQGLQHTTFYINGRAPPYSTPKPVRFITVNADPELSKIKLPELTWIMCHNYANWTGPVKLPSSTQYAHKLAELAGQMPDHGKTILAGKYAGKYYFL